MINTRNDPVVYLLGDAANYHVTADVSGEMASCIRARHHTFQLVIDSGTPAVIIEGSLLSPGASETVPDAKHWAPLTTLNASNKMHSISNVGLVLVRARRADGTTNGVKVIYHGFADMTDN